MISVLENSINSEDLKIPGYLSKNAPFVNYIINTCKIDNGFRARLKRADNPATEYQSWEVLAIFNVNIEFEDQRLPYLLISAAVARAKVEKNGVFKIGAAIARCYEDGSSSDQAKSKLRRLLACDSVQEAFRILRPLLSLIESKGNVSLDFIALLDDLIWFSHTDSQIRIKAKWAQDFYRNLRVGDKSE